MLALVDVTHNTAYTLSAYQTPAVPKAPKMSTVPKGVSEKDEAKAAEGGEEQTKAKFVNGVREHGLHLVSKLRYDADLASTRAKFVLMICHALNWQGAWMGRVSIPPCCSTPIPTVQR